MQRQQDPSASTKLLLSSLELMLQQRNYPVVDALIRASSEHFTTQHYDEIVGPRLVENASDFKEVFKLPLGEFLLKNASNTLALAVKAQPADVQYLVESFAPKASKNQLGRLVLQLIHDNHIASAKWILKNIKKINLNCRMNATGDEVLHLALQKEVLDFELVELLCKHGANLQNKNIESTLPLDIAFRKQQYHVIALFARDYADKLTAAQSGDIVLSMTTVQEKQIVKSLLSQKHAMNSGWIYKATGNDALHCEALSDTPDLDLLVLLVSAGFKLDMKNLAGETPLAILFKKNQYSTIGTLINKFPTFRSHAQDLIAHHGYSFHKALEAQNPDHELISMLSSAHMNITLTNAENKSVLEVARTKNQLSILKYFIVRHINQFEISQLLEIIPFLLQTDNFDVIKFIREKRSLIVRDPQYQNDLIAKAFSLVLHEREISAAAIKSLCQAGMNLSKENHDGKSLLSLSVEHGRFAVIKALVEEDISNRAKNLDALKKDKNITELEQRIELERAANIFKIRQIEEVIPLLINRNQQGLVKLILANYTNIAGKYFSDVILVQALTRAVLAEQSDLEYIELLCNAARVNPLHHVPGSVSPFQLALDHKPYPLVSVVEKFLLTSNDKMGLDHIVKALECLVKDNIENLIHLKYLQSKSIDYHIIKAAAYKVIIDKLDATDNAKDIFKIVKFISEMSKAHIGFLRNSHAFVSTFRAKKWDNHSVSSEWLELMEKAKQRIMAVAKDSIYSKDIFDFLMKPAIKNQHDSLAEAVKYHNMTRDLPKNTFWSKNTLPTDRMGLDEKGSEFKMGVK
jgi:ankyrin repeat protein